MGTDATDGDEQVQAKTRMDESAYDRWAETVPRRTPLAERHRQLLEADAEHDGNLIAHAESEAGPSIEELEQLAERTDDRDRVALIRIRKHAMRASQQLDADPDSAREEITDILNKVDSVL
jgi:arsenate reductase-like glutaredoxin family protein